MIQIIRLIDSVLSLYALSTKSFISYWLFTDLANVATKSPASSKRRLVGAAYLTASRGPAGPPICVIEKYVL
jgi:hypothetical protein